MAKRNKSALKANRQNIKRREHNRALRSKLRTGLKAIRKSLDALPEPLRDAFEQREQGGLSYAEIAQRQQVPVGTVRSRIHRAREAIAHDLKPLMENA